MPALSTGLREAAVRQLDPQPLVTYQGKVLLVLEPTEYAQRSRARVSGPGWGCGASGSGLWRARSVPAGIRRARATLRSRKPSWRKPWPCGSAWGGGPSSAATRAWGAKSRSGAGPTRSQTRCCASMPPSRSIRPPPPLASSWPRRWRGAVDGDRGAEGIRRCRRRCRRRTLRATLRFRRTGRKDAVQETTVNVGEAVPGAGAPASLVVATPLPVDTVAPLRAIVRLYAQRWAMETGFETRHMPAWGQEAFMVRRWTASDRLLGVVAVAYALVVLALYQRTLRAVRRQATAVLKALSVVGDQLTGGKLAEAIGLDDQQHRRAWIAAWLR